MHLVCVSVVYAVPKHSWQHRADGEHPHDGLLANLRPNGSAPAS